MTEPITRDRYLQLIADESIPFAHRVLWALLWEGNLLRDDLLSLDVRDIDLNARTIVVEFPKQGAPKAAPFSPTSAVVLRMLIDKRTEGPLFVDADSRPLTQDAVMRQATEAGVKLHGFRLGGQMFRSQPEPSAPSSQA
jgi:integrase